MKPEEQRIAVAKACGWSKCACGDPECGAWFGPHDTDPHLDIPDYLNDLNAMHSAEEVLHGEKWAEYFDLIQRTGKATGVRATAAQRAEAFLRTLGLWKEDE